MDDTEDSISIIVSTFGDPVWKVRAERALLSAHQQVVAAHEVIYNHCDTLHEARNRGAAQATGEWLVFLDADDELDQFFVKGMTDAIWSSKVLSNAITHLIRPAQIGVRSDGVYDLETVVLPEKPLPEGNFMIIATAVQRSLFHQVGGFRDLPIYEDWDLWIRCWRAGAGFHVAPDAVYVIHVADGSRNNQDRGVQETTYHRIRADYF